ncbi:MAG: nuclear transport factor 2 family protein [Chiayiivirga sp.]|jgi:hypothetical protein|uniref:nuclear transport factor 2 family protein n=1 Tax=Chiayiivirga sp. TaxID=2041042 RepID=UPI0025C43C27|nr:nuclear transport factor 2 family protein [Chiayiivirga sp.]MCI1710943.1 nuclear transport factor 2 family protein [Chiayiivirga sp.]MCI1728262.1 nuclear transport factor 2 family protein [Chiayiivirga sp.]
MFVRLFLLWSLLISGTAFAQESAPDFAKRVRDFVAASNQHDVAAMIAATEPEFRWIQIVGSQATVEVAGHSDLKAWLESYFASTPDAHSDIGPVAVHGLFASTVETSRWKRQDGTPAMQSSTSVYEFAPDGRIRHVWYFNAQSPAGMEDDAAPAQSPAPDAASATTTPRGPEARVAGMTTP